MNTLSQNRGLTAVWKIVLATVLGAFWCLVPVARAVDITVHFTNNTPNTIYYNVKGFHLGNTFFVYGYPAPLSAGQASSATIANLNQNDPINVVWGSTSTECANNPSLMHLSTTGATTYYVNTTDTNPGFEVLPTVWITQADSDGVAQETSTPSAADSGILRLHRTGSTASDLSVSLSESGIGSFGLTSSYDWSLMQRTSPNYPYISTSATIPAGSATVDLWVVAWYDGIYESDDETAIVTIASNASYSVATPNSIRIWLYNTGNPCSPQP